ncbi:sialidase family protein [Streptomyces sp. NPDC054933]
MRARASATAAAALLLFASTAGAAQAGPSRSAPADQAGQPVHLISPGDPYAACDIKGDGSGTNSPSSEVEPYVSVDPRDPHHAIGVFQQDRWSNGGARGLTATYTTDGIHFTETALPYSHCAPGGLPYQRASDAWISIGPDGTAYSSGLVFDATDARNGVAASTSYDDGRTWRNTVPLIQDNDPAIGDDKNSVTADPLHPGTAYQVWDRIDQVTTGANPHFDGPAYLSVTRDHGRTWSKARPFVTTATTPDTQTIGNVIVVDPRTGTLYDFFDSITYSDYNATTATDAHFAVVTSTDQGRTWSKPVKVAGDTSVPEVDPNAPTDPTKALRAGGGLPSAAIDPRTGELYVAYEGSEFTGGQYDAVQLVHSVDGGHTWSGPERVNQAPNAPAFTPSITVDSRGTVAVTYYDLRYLTPGDTTTLPTAAWLVTLPHGDADYPTERRISRIFNWLQAPSAGGHFLGDYEGIARSGSGVRPILVEANDNSPLDSTDAFSGTFQASSIAGSRAARAPIAPEAVPPGRTARTLRR